MPRGDAFTRRQRADIERAAREAEQVAGLSVSVFVGRLEGPSREAAERLHASLEDPDAVLVAVDPGARALEIVTGEGAKRRIDERTAGLVALSMTTSFQGGDLAGGIVTGVRMLAQHAEALRRG